MKSVFSGLISKCGKSELEKSEPTNYGVMEQDERPGIVETATLSLTMVNVDRDQFTVFYTVIAHNS